MSEENKTIPQAVVESIQKQIVVVPPPSDPLTDLEPFKTASQEIRIGGTEIATKAFAGKRLYNMIEFYGAVACEAYQDPSLCQAANDLLESLREVDPIIPVDVDMSGRARFIRSANHLENWRYHHDYGVGSIWPDSPTLQKLPKFIRWMANIVFVADKSVPVVVNNSSPEGHSDWLAMRADFPYWRSFATLDRKALIAVKKQLASMGVEFDPQDDEGWAFISLADIGSYLEQAKAIINKYSAESNDPDMATFRVVEAIEHVAEARMRMFAFGVALKQSPLFEHESIFRQIFETYLTGVKDQYLGIRNVILSDSQTNKNLFISKFSSLDEMIELYCDITENTGLEDVILFLGLRNFAGDDYRYQEDAKHQKGGRYANPW